MPRGEDLGGSSRSHKKYATIYEQILNERVDATAAVVAFGDMSSKICDSAAIGAVMWLQADERGQ